MRKIFLLLAVTATAALAQPDTLSLDLSGWVGLAMENSPEMEISSADLMISEASLRSTRSFLWPTLSLGSSGRHSWSSVPDMSGGYTDTEGTTWSMSAGVSQELLASGGSSWLRLSGSRRSHEASRFDHRQTGLDLTMDVIEAYYGVVEAAGLLESAQRALDRSTEQLSRTSSLYRMGGATNLELIQAEVQQSSDSLTLLQRENAVSSAYVNLRRTAGVTGSPYRVNTEAVLQPVTINTALGYSLDTSGSNILAASEERLAAAEYSWRAARRSYWPSLTAGGSWNWSDDELDFEDFSSRDSWQVSLSLQWTLFDGFNRESIIQSSRASMLRQEASHRALENSVESSLITARNDLVNSIRRWELSLQVLNQAREQLRLSRMSYELGSISLLDLLDAQSQLASAEASVESSRTASLIAEARLLVLLGRSPRVGE
ncbi:MAG: TolC family protein [Candidatus Aegiribacteria sp.]